MLIFDDTSDHQVSLVCNTFQYFKKQLCLYEYKDCYSQAVLEQTDI